MQSSNLSQASNGTNQINMNQNGPDFSIDLRLGRQKRIQSLHNQPLPYSSNFYQDLTREKYEVERCFEGGNYNYLRNLPDFYTHKQILNQKKQKVEYQKMLQTAPEHLKDKKRVTKLQGGGYFDQFIYYCDDYNWAKYDQRQDWIQQHEKMKQISDHDFRPADTKLKLKYEAPFYYEEQKQIHGDKTQDRLNKLMFKKLNYELFPFHIETDTYDVLKESKTRQRLISEANRIGSDWKPAQSGQILKKTSKQRLDDIVLELKQILQSDWTTSKFFIAINEKEQLEVVFDFTTVNNPDLLNSYMNSLLNDERLTIYQLRKQVDQWFITNNDYKTLTFVICPPWVKQSHFETYYNLHPENNRNFK